MAKILVVDDEVDVVTLVQFLLEKEGHTVDVAYNGKEALAHLGLDSEGKGALQNVPDLILLDVMMPVMDGPTFASKFTGTDTLRNIHVIVLSAKGQIREVFKRTGLRATYLEKPFDPKRLRQTVTETLQGDSPE